MEYYSVLELNKNCTQEEIEKSYKKLALRYHPDRNPGDNEAASKFVKIQEAYNTLKDPGKRQQYDNPIQQGFNPFGFHMNMHMNHGDMFDTEDLDIKIRINIAFKEAVCGCDKKIYISRRQPCTGCSGFGFSDSSFCHACQGKGVIVNNANNFFRFQTPCGRCMGKGKIGTTRCSTCVGQKYQQAEEKEVSVKIPSGIMNGMILNLNGQGHLGTTGRVGNVLIECRIDENKNYQLNGLDVNFYHRIKYSTMIFGGKIEIPTFEDDVIEVEIPPMTQSLTSFRIKEKGMPDIRTNGSMRGDLVAMVVADVPLNIQQDVKTYLINHGL